MYDDLYSLIRLKPNRSLVDIPFASPRTQPKLGLYDWHILKLRLWIYNKANRKNENKLRWWFKNKVGELPVIVDTALVEKSIVNMKNYLANRGYYQSEISYEIYFYHHPFNNNKLTQKVLITYNVETKNALKIDSYKIDLHDLPLQSLTIANQHNSLIHENDNFDTDIIDKERDRLTSIFRNNGYLKFQKDLLYFDADTNLTSGKAKLTLKIQKPEDVSQLKPYRIANVYVHTDYSFVSAQDTTIIYDTVVYNNINYISKKKIFRPTALDQKIFVRKGKYYSQEKNNLTITRLSDIPIIRYANVKYVNLQDSVNNQADCNVYITKRNNMEYQYESDGSFNTANYIGTSLNAGFKHKNIFKGGEVLSLKQRLGAEWAFEGLQGALNTLDINTQVELSFPQFAFLPRFIKPATINNPRTLITARNNFQNRVGYFQLNTSVLTFGYTWNETRTKQHQLLPISFNLTRIIKIASNFQEELNAKPALQQSFQEQFILGTSWKFTYNNALVKNKNTTYVLCQAEIAGNLLKGLGEIMGFNKNYNNQLLLFGLPFSQFFKSEIDARKFFGLNKRSSFVTRLNAGIGVPFGNSGKVLPFIKQFYIGGNNSVRAFPLRKLGPGSYISPNVLDTARYVYIDQTGDIKIEGNAEFRFDIFKWFKGAWFLDAGNIWLLHKNEQKPNASFEFDRFYKEIAVGTGLGLRFDASYFILRLDLGLPLRKPTLPESERWLFDKISLQSPRWRNDNLILNFAIGYPF